MTRIEIGTLLRWTAAATLAAGSILSSTGAFAEPLGFAGSGYDRNRPVQEILTDSIMTTESQDTAEINPHLRRQIVSYSTREAPGTVIIDTPNTYLYLVLGSGRAIRYGIGVGREGFTWSGVKTVERKTEWPDWLPPDEMIERQPYLPRFMAGGPGNPLGARAMYLGGSLYRIHGTNDPSTIGKRVSSGCIRLVNDDVIDLYEHVNIGTKVIVLPMHAGVADRPGPDLPLSISNATQSATANGGRGRGLY